MESCQRCAVCLLPPTDNRNSSKFRNNNNKSVRSSLFNKYIRKAYCVADFVNYVQKRPEFCNECGEELDKLDKLHQKLETVNKKIDSKVNEIRAKHIGFYHDLKSNKQKGSPPMSSRMTGNTVLSQVLNKFLGDLCDGLEDGSSNSKTGSQTGHEKRVTESPSGKARDHCEVNLNPEIKVEPEEIKTEPTGSSKGNSSGDEYPSDDEDHSFLKEDLKQEPDQKDLPAPSKKRKRIGPTKEEKEMMEFIKSERKRMGTVKAPSKPRRPPVKRHECGTCQRKFAKRSDLVRHERTHTGEIGHRPWNCDLCDMRFDRECSLTTHRRVHTGEKPFSCDLCSIQFSQRSNLFKHNRRKHPA